MGAVKMFFTSEFLVYLSRVKNIFTAPFPYDPS